MDLDWNWNCLFLLSSWDMTLQQFCGLRLGLESNKKELGLKSTKAGLYPLLLFMFTFPFRIFGSLEYWNLSFSVSHLLLWSRFFPLKFGCDLELFSRYLESNEVNESRKYRLPKYKILPVESYFYIQSILNFSIIHQPYVTEWNFL